MNHEVYAYWNLRELEGVFNAIAALTASDDFTGLLRLLAMLALLAIALGALAGRLRHEDLWRWIIMLAIVNGLLFVPKSSVTLVDRTGTEAPRVVANVPIGLAAQAHMTSKIGDWLTRAYETVFSLPDDLQFQKHGLMFGHRILNETQRMSPDQVSQAWMHDFQEFWRECVSPDIESGYLTLDTLRTATNLWASLNDTNPARFVTLSTTGTVACKPAAYNNLSERLNDALVPQLLTRYADTRFPADPLAANKIRSSIVATYTQGLALTGSAEVIVRQAAMQNAAVQAYCGVFAQLGDSARAAQCYAAESGAYQTNFTYQTLAKIAESSMPKLKSAIEMIQYAVFPIILAFAIVAGHLGLAVIKIYLQSLVWVQLWPPLYAVIHYLQTVKMREYGEQLGGLAGTLAGQAQLVNMGISDQAVAGMLVIAIPPIAAALVKGGEVGLQAVAGLVSAPRQAERQAADTAKGNESTAQWNTSPTINQGVSRVRHTDGSWMATHADGSTTFDAGSAVDKASFRVSAAGRASQAASKLSESAQSASISETTSFAQTTAAALQQSVDFVRSRASGEKSAQGAGIGDQSGFTQAVNETQRITESFAKKQGLDQTQAAQLMGMASISIQNPKALDLFSPVSVKAAAQLSGKSEATAKHLLEEARNFAKETGFSQSVDKVRRASQQMSFDASDESSRRAMAGIRAGFDRSQQHIDQAASQYQQSQSYREAAIQLRENALSVDQDLTTRVMNRLASEQAMVDFHHYNGFRKDEVDALMRSNNPEMRSLVDRIANEETEAMLRERAGQMQDAGAIRDFFNQGKAHLGGSASSVEQQGRQWQGQVTSQAGSAGVTPGSRVASTLPAQVITELGDAGQRISAGQGQVNSLAQPLVQKVHDQTAPGSQVLSGLAFSNAVGQITPDSWSEKRVDWGLATPGSAVTEAGAERSRQGEARDPLGNLIGDSASSLGDAASKVKDGLGRSIRGEENYIGNTLGLKQEKSK